MINPLTPSLSNEAACAILKDKIANRIPFSLVRLGDAEVHYLKGTAPEKLRKLVCELWGYSNYQESEVAIRAILNNALRAADMVGIMDPHNEIVSKFKYNMDEWTIANSYMQSLREDSDYAVCDHQLPRSNLLGNIHNFKNVLNGNSLNILSPNRELLDVDFSSILDARVKVTLIENDRKNLLKQLPLIQEDVVIYGASLFGKDIGTILKEDHGKTCVDFGATLDAWAGLTSRKWFNEGNIQSHCIIKRPT